MLHICWIVDSYWMGMRTIANFVPPRQHLFSDRENSCVVEGNNKFAIVRNAHSITVLFIPMQTLDVNKCVVI
jgi:hypothetical protein